MAIRSTDDVITVENSFHILEVNLMVTKVAFTLLWVPIEGTNARKQLGDVAIRHGLTP
jgi:hypothetical protein